MFKETNLKPRRDGNNELGSLTLWFVIWNFSALLAGRWIGTALVDSALFHPKLAWKFFKKLLITFDIKMQSSLIWSLLRDISMLNKTEFSICLARSTIESATCYCFFLLEVVSADVQNDLLILRKLQVRFKIILHGFWTRKRLYHYPMANSYF